MYYPQTFYAGPAAKVVCLRHRDGEDVRRPVLDALARAAACPRVALPGRVSSSSSSTTTSQQSATTTLAAAGDASNHRGYYAAGELGLTRGQRAEVEALYAADRAAWEKRCA